MKQTNPLKFLSLLKWLDGRPMLDVLMRYHLSEIEESFFTFTDDGVPQYLRALWGRGKKNAKTLCGVLLALYACLVWKAAGRKGNQIYFIASDLGQANDDLDLAKKLIGCNDTLKREVTVKVNRIERKDGGGFIEILPAQDVDGLHGKSYLLAVFDEAHTMRDYRVLEALELDRTRPDARQLFLSYASPYRHAGVPLVDMQKQHEAGSDPRLYVAWHAGTIEEANPSMDGPLGPTREDIEQAKRSLPSWVFRRLYLNLPGQPDQAAFNADKIESCIDSGVTVRPPQDGMSYQAFTDMSAGGPDDSTLAIAHVEGTHAVLDLLIDQGPRLSVFDPNQAVKKFSDVLKQYRLSSVTGDNFAKAWPQKAFASHGINYIVSPQTKAQLYASFEPKLNAGTVRLLDQPVLLQQLVGLVLKGEKVDDGGQHDDHANSVCGALALLPSGQTFLCSLCHDPECCGLHGGGSPEPTVSEEHGGQEIDHDILMGIRHGGKFYFPSD